MREKRTLTIYLPKSYIRALDKLNKKESRSKLMRQILRKFLREELLFRAILCDRDNEHKAISVNISDKFLNLANDLVNSMGKSDLFRKAVREYLKKKLLNNSKGFTFEVKSVIFREEDLVEVNDNADPTNKTAPIGVRVTGATKKALEAQAKQKNLKFSEFVRQALEEKIQINNTGGKQ